MVIEPSANLWSVSDVTKQVGVSGSLLNLTSGVVDNYGLLTTVVNRSFPYACAGLDPSGPVVQPTGSGNIVINNYGTLGQNYNSECGPDMIFPTTLYKSPPYAITLNNYGAVWAVNGTQGFIGGLPGSGPGLAATINNYSGGRIGTSTGSALNQGNANNYRNAGMFVTANWSWCEHGNAGWFFNNWGYCIGAEEGIYEESAGTQPQISLYGGPLIPAAHDLNGNLVYGGSVSAQVTYGKWANYSLCVADLPLALSSSAPILVSNNANQNAPFASINLYNTVYSYIDPTDGTAKTVNYLPLLLGYPMLGSGAHISLHFDQLYADEAAQLMNDVTAGNRAAGTANFFQVYDGATNQFVAPATWASKGMSTDSGYTYSWCNTAPVTTRFTNTQSINRPAPQVYFIDAAGPSGGGRQYFLDPKAANGNPYYLVNPSTVRLVGNVPQPPGTLYVGPGWTLAVGANLATTTPLNLPNLVGSPLTSAELIADYGLGSAGTTTANTPASFTFSPNSTINLQSATGMTNDNVDNQPIPVMETLSGSLVIDNFDNPSGKNPVSLPNLVGGGNLIQSGNSTTTLMGAANDLSGSIFLYDGTLVVAPSAGFLTPPNFIFGQNDGNLTLHHPVLDLSQVTTPGFVVHSVEMSGPQMGVANVGSGTGLVYTTILLGKTVLTIASPSGAGENHLEAVLTGTGGLDLKPQVSLVLGYWAYHDAGPGERAVDLSTFSGGTTVEAGATLKINSRGALGYGDLSNSGTVGLAGAQQYLTTWLNDAAPLPQSPPGTLPIGAQLVDAKTPLVNTFDNHTVFVKGNYTQAASGNLTLRVRQGDLDSASLGSGAGIQYETVVVGGSASLNGTLTLQLMSGYELPAGGVVLAVVQAGSPIIGHFAQVLTTSDGVTFTAHPLSSQQVVSVAQPIGGGSTSVLELTVR
jgi:autotransporter-associated beta strand protein